MNPVENLISLLREFLNTLAGKVSALAAFVLLMIVLLAAFGARIPREYAPLVYVMTLVVLIVGAVVGTRQVQARRRSRRAADRAAGARNVVVHGDARDNLIVTGDHNRVER